jgi:hypothetical protein
VDDPPDVRGAATVSQGSKTALKGAHREAGMVGRLICWWKKKHLRGKFVRAEDNGRVKFFACPRCGRETSYKGKAA